MKHIASILLLLAPLPAAFAAEAQPLLNAPYITGTHYTARELVPAYLDDVGQPVTDDRLEAISQRVEEMYRRDGFLIPLIVTQSATGPTPHLHVFEARVAEVNIRGDAGAYREKVEAIAAELRAQPVLHKAQTQRAIHAIEDLPGLTVRAAFEPVESGRNAFALTLSVGFERMNGSAALSNRVSDDIGDGLVYGRLVLNSVLGASERLTFTAAGSTSLSKYRYFSARAERGFGPLHLDLQASRADAHTQPQSNYIATRYSVEASIAALRRNGLTVRPLVSASLRNASDHDGAGDPWNITHTRSVLGGVEISDKRDARVTRVRATAERGLDIWKASTYQRHGSPADVVFTKAAFEASHSVVLAPGWQARALAEGQWTRDDLPSGERFVYGGAQSGRAFDSGAIFTDTGATVSLQLDRYRQWNNAWLNYGRAFVQADYAIGKDNVDGSDRARGASLSLGLSARSHALTSTVELGYALKRVSGGDAQAHRLGAFFSTQYAF
jgi:hemolysin activation/secretion protein